MKIQCDCGAFEAELTGFPRHSPGRLACYCDDCQAYLERLGRAELLDDYGGTEVIPVYPAEFEIRKGKELLRLCKVTPNGADRWSTTCCNSPIVNTRAGFPWAGVFRSAFLAADPEGLGQLGDVRCRVRGRHAKNDPPFRISEKLTLADMLTVMPFMLKGKLLGKQKSSPFYESDGRTPIAEPVLLEEPGNTP